MIPTTYFYCIMDLVDHETGTTRTLEAHRSPVTGQLFLVEPPAGRIVIDPYMGNNVKLADISKTVLGPQT